MTTLPTPGSPEAIKAGCTCPQADNHHGRGAYGAYGGIRDPKTGEVQYWVNDRCPMHGDTQ